MELFTLESLQGQQLWHFWPNLEAELKETPIPEVDTETVKLGLLSHDIQPWVILDARRVAHFVGLTSLQEGDNGRSLWVLWIKGKNPDVAMAMLSGLERWGQLMDCARIEYMGRKGWLKWLEPRGYEEKDGIVGKWLGAPDRVN